MTQRKASSSDKEVHISMRMVIGVAAILTISVIGWVLGRGAGPEDALQSGAPGAPIGEWRSLALTPAEGELYLASKAGVYHSSDDGSSWTELALPLTPGDKGVADVVVNPSSPSTLYVAGDGLGVLQSGDAGSSWTSVSASLPQDGVDALAMHSENFETLYAHLDNKVYETRDGGATWRRPVDGPPAQAVALAHSTLPGSMNTGWLYAAMPDGLYLSMD